MMEDCYDYEIVDTKQSEGEHRLRYTVQVCFLHHFTLHLYLYLTDPPLQQVCSLYQLANDETLYTCK